MKTILFSDASWNYYSDGTFGNVSKWKVEDGIVYWWNYADILWTRDYPGIQLAYKRYIANLITSGAVDEQQQ